MESQKWMTNLVIVRHAESQRNVAKEMTQAGIAETYGDGTRDVDVKLTDRGHQQAEQSGTKLRDRLGFDFDRVFTSPYRRTVQTTEYLLKGFRHPPEPVLEERIREKEFGILDGLTKVGIERRYPGEKERKELNGKYYYRPPGGESYPDVNLRVHDFIGTMVRECREENVLVVCHSVIVLSFRHLLERMTEKDVLDVDVDKEREPKNCSITWYAFDASHGTRGKLRLKEYNLVLYDSNLSTAEPSRTGSSP
jgi:probable phosphoglycerate mutase